MALAHQFLGQPGHHPLGAAIKGGRDAFHQGGDLRDFHDERPFGSALFTTAFKAVRFRFSSQLRQNGRQQPFERLAAIDLADAGA